MARVAKGLLRAYADHSPRREKEPPKGERVPEGRNSPRREKESPKGERAPEGRNSPRREKEPPKGERAPEGRKSPRREKEPPKGERVPEGRKSPRREKEYSGGRSAASNPAFLAQRGQQAPQVPTLRNCPSPVSAARPHPGMTTPLSAQRDWYLVD